MSDTMRGLGFLLLAFAFGRLSIRIEPSSTVGTIILSVAGTLFVLSLAAHFHGKKND